MGQFHNYRAIFGLDIGVHFNNGSHFYDRANALKFENFKQVVFIPTSFLAFG